MVQSPYSAMFPTYSDSVGNARIVSFHLLIFFIDLYLLIFSRRQKKSH